MIWKSTDSKEAVDFQHKYGCPPCNRNQQQQIDQVIKLLLVGSPNNKNYHDIKGN